MKKEVINGNFKQEYYSIHFAKEHVYNHRNIFSKSTRRYVFRTYPPIIKEIDTAPDGKKQYWFWCFLENKKIIYKFNKKPSQNQLKEMLNDFEKERRC